MTINDLATRLSKTYNKAEHGTKVITVIIFGIQHAKLFEEFPARKVVELAGIPSGQLSELRKGIGLHKSGKLTLLS